LDARLERAFVLMAAEYGTGAAIRDFCARFGATMLVGLGWPALLLS